MRRLDTIERWRPVQVNLRDERGYEDPYHAVDLGVELSSPSGAITRVSAFWDGGRDWRFRFSPGEIGRWHWRSVCSDPANAGLHNLTGEIDCVPSSAQRNPNPFDVHGPVAPMPGGWHLAHADGTPFFWLGDTAWNGVLRAGPSDWGRYLDLRAAQGFSVIHHFSLTWRGLPTAPGGASSFEAGPPVRVHPDVFRPMDEKVRDINRHGMLAAPLLILALYETDPGWALPEDEVSRLARYVMARWGAYHVVWSLGGDGDFAGPRADRWRRIGRATAADAHGRPTTMHPLGLGWDADEFRDEDWFGLIAYQSCHFAAADARSWLVTGPLRDEWLKPPPRPILNVEPNYEEHPALDTGEVFTDRDVREAIYRSLLSAPVAGITYGNFHVWSWSDTPEDRTGTLPGRSDAWTAIGPWHAHLNTPGARQAVIARRILEAGPWTGLRPAPRLLEDGPGEADPLHRVIASATEDGSWFLAYAPRGVREVRLTSGTTAPAQGRWLDPRTGRSCEAVGADGTFGLPSDDDWVLELHG